jgi:hypothetical protein
MGHHTSMGGSALYIETQGSKRSKLDADGKPKGGGSQGYWTLGDVMKVRTLISFQFDCFTTPFTLILSLQESTQIATVARARLAGIDDTNCFFDNTLSPCTCLKAQHRWSLRRRRHGDINVIARVGSADSNDLAMTGEISHW